MVGRFEIIVTKTSRLENEDLPRFVEKWNQGWKCFCIVGDYMKDSTALGLLNGMITEASEYYIYPVVNAQNHLNDQFSGICR